MSVGTAPVTSTISGTENIYTHYKSNRAFARDYGPRKAEANLIEKSFPITKSNLGFKIL